MNNESPSLFDQQMAGAKKIRKEWERQVRVADRLEARLWREQAKCREIDKRYKEALPHLVPSAPPADKS